MSCGEMLGDHTDIPLLIVLSHSAFSIGPAIVLLCKMSPSEWIICLFGCAQFSLLCVGFPWLQQAGG